MRCEYQSVPGGSSSSKEKLGLQRTDLVHQLQINKINKRQCFKLYYFWNLQSHRLCGGTGSKGQGFKDLRVFFNHFCFNTLISALGKSLLKELEVKNV